MYALLNTLNLFAPGFLIVAAVKACTLEKKDSLAPTFGDLFVGLVATVVIISLMCMVTLELEVFRHRVLQGTALCLNILFAAFITWRFLSKKLSFSTKHMAPDGYFWIISALLLTAVFLRVPISRYVYGGQDQGTYTIIALMMARTGKIHQHSPVLARIETEPELKPLRKAFKHFSKKSGLAVKGRYEGAAYPGFYISNGKKGGITPQFFHLHPAWMSVTGWLWGRKQCVYSLLLFSILGLLAVGIISKCLFQDEKSGKACGIATTALLTFQILQVWTSRYPVSEIPYQAFLLCGLALLGIALKKAGGDHGCPRNTSEGKNETLTKSENPAEKDTAKVNSLGFLTVFIAAVGGMCLGMTFFVRITAAFIIPLLFLLYILGPGKTSPLAPVLRAFFIAVILTTAWAGVHGYAHSYPYVYDLVRKRLGIRLLFDTSQVALFAGFGVVFTVLMKELVIDRFGSKPRDLLHSFLLKYKKPLAAAAVAAVVIALAHQLITAPIFDQRGARVFRIARIYQFALFVSWPALLGGLLGMGCLLGGNHGFFPKMVGFMGLGVTPMILLWPAYNRYAYYYARYYVSDLLPFLFLALVFGSIPAIKALWRSIRTRDKLKSRLLAWTGFAFICIAGAWIFGFGIKGHFTNPTYDKTELKGAWDATHNIALQIPKNCLLLMNRRGPRKGSPGFHVMLGTTLSFVYGYETILIGRLKKIHPKLLDLNRPLFLFEESWQPRTKIANKRYMFLQTGGGILPFNHSQKTLKPPKKYENKWYHYFLYRPRPVDQYTVKPGTRIWSGRTRGFYPRERNHAWTKGVAHIWGLPATPGRAVDLTVKTRGIFPRALRCKITIEINGRKILSREFEGKELNKNKGIGPIRVKPGLNRGSLDLTIKSCKWKPSEVFGKSDPRKLGLDIHSVEIKSVSKAQKP